MHLYELLNYYNFFYKAVLYELNVQINVKNMNLESILI